MSPIRVVVQQPSLAQYRVPVFRELARRPGIDLLVVYGDRKGIRNAQPDGFEAEFAPLWRRQLGPAPLAWHTPQWRYASKRRCDVVVLTGNVQYLSLYPALLRARASRIGAIVWGHGYSKRARSWGAKPRAVMYRLATAALFYNQQAARHAVDDWNFPAEKCFVAPNSLDQVPILAARQHWLDRPHELIEFQQQHQLDPAQTILFVSRLHADNGLDQLLKAVNELKDEFPKLRTVLIGSGDPEAQRLRGLAEHLRIKNHLIMPGAIYDESELAPWFLSSRMFCYPQNMGLSLLHAFGYGLPVISSDRRAGQNPEFEALVDGQNGLCFRHRDHRDLADTIKTVMKDDSLHQRMSVAAQKKVTTEFTIEKMVDGFEAAIHFAFDWHKST